MMARGAQGSSGGGRVRFHRLEGPCHHRCASHWIILESFVGEALMGALPVTLPPTSQKEGDMYSGDSPASHPPNTGAPTPVLQYRSRLPCVRPNPTCVFSIPPPPVLLRNLNSELITHSSRSLPLTSKSAQISQNETDLSWIPSPPPATTLSFLILSIP